MLQNENNELKLSNESLADSVTDLKCRSMRDNLLFFGIPEGPVSNYEVLTSNQTGIIQDGRDPSEGLESSTPPQAITNSTVLQETGDRETDEPRDVRPKTTSTSEMPRKDHTILTDDCVAKVYLFCEQVLKISDPSKTLKIERAHRIGAFDQKKTRPIVVKFDSPSKMIIKDKLKGVNLSDAIQRQRSVSPGSSTAQTRTYTKDAGCAQRWEESNSCPR